MPKHKAAMVTYLLIFSITVMAFGESESPGGKVVEVKSQEELASLAGGLNWSDNNTIYIMVPTLSQENSTSPVNESMYPQTDALSSLKPSSGIMPAIILHSKTSIIDMHLPDNAVNLSFFNSLE